MRKHWNLLNIIEFVLIYGLIALLLYVAARDSGIISFGKPDDSEIDFESVQLVRVVDGDTLLVSSEGEDVRVRMIGIDTPESVHPDERLNTAEGIKASEYVKELLDGVGTLYLEYDVEKYDKYERVLAYVWLSDTVNPNNPDDTRVYMLNAILLEHGIANEYEYPPNMKYVALFRQIADGR